MTTGEKLSKLRKESGYTQEALAEIIGVSRQSISKWESDGAFPETEKLIQLSRLYKCSIDYLLKDEVEIVSNNLENTKKHKLSNYLSKNLFTSLWSVGIFIITILFYLFPYVTDEVYNNGYFHGYVKFNIYDLLSAGNYEIGNILILTALLAEFFMLIIGIIIYIKNDKRLFKVRKILSVYEVVIWIYLMFSLIIECTFQIGMIFMILSSLGNLVGLTFIDFNKYQGEDSDNSPSIIYSVTICLLMFIIYFFDLIDYPTIGDFNAYEYMFKNSDLLSILIWCITLINILILSLGILIKYKNNKKYYTIRLVLSIVFCVISFGIFLWTIDMVSVLMSCLSIVNILCLTLVKSNKYSEVCYE